MKRLKILPATQTLGALFPHKLVLELRGFTRSEVQAARTGARDSEPARVLAHEMTHWFDILGTVWGQDYLDTLFRAYDRILSCPAPQITAYPEALKLFDTDREILFPSYYKFVKEHAVPRHGPGTWEMSVTTGTRIRSDGTANEDDPILFVRFDEHGSELVRQPITVGALIEMRALNMEVSAFRELAPLRPAEERLVEEAIYRRDSVKLFYDPHLTTYSAAAHLLSNALAGTDDTALVMELGARLADVALNVTPTLFRRLKPPPELSASPPRRRRGFVDRVNRGYLFASLCYSMRQLAVGVQEEAILSDLLKRIGLPSSGGVVDAAETYIARRRPSELVDPRLRRIRTALRDAGLEILKRRYANGGLIWIADWADLPSPRIMDYDAETFLVGQEVLSEADVDYLNDCSVKADMMIRQALRAGRGLEFQFSDFVY